MQDPIGLIQMYFLGGKVNREIVLKKGFQLERLPRPFYFFMM